MWGAATMSCRVCCHLISAVNRRCVLVICNLAFFISFFPLKVIKKANVWTFAAIFLFPKFMYMLLTTH